VDKPFFPPNLIEDRVDTQPGQISGTLLEGCLKPAQGLCPVTQAEMDLGDPGR